MGKKGKTLTQDVSFKVDEQRSGDVGNASAKKVTSESDNDGNDCEPSVQDTNKSADVTNVREETVTKENNSDSSVIKIDRKKSGDVPNVLEETVKIYERKIRVTVLVKVILRSLVMCPMF